MPILNRYMYDAQLRITAFMFVNSVAVRSVRLICNIHAIIHVIYESIIKYVMGSVRLYHFRVQVERQMYICISYYGNINPVLFKNF